MESQMMELHENKKLFADTVLAAAESLNINAVYIEKDYWITRSLRLLSNNVNAKNVVFKGGTSLSKAYHIVNRFSEDIDIAVVDADSMNGNQVKNLIKRVAKEMTAGLEEIPTDGVTSKGSRYYKALYRYPNKLGKTLNATVNVGQLLVEVNSFANPYPYETKTITSFIAEFFEKTGNQHLIEQYGLQPFSLNVLDKRRTMAEKLVSLVRFSFSDNYLHDVASKIRHFYDLHYLASDTDCANYMQSASFKTDFETLLAHDQQTFDTPEGWKMRKVAESPLVADFPKAWKSLREKYKTELPAIAYAAIPDEKSVAESFEKIVEPFKKLRFIDLFAGLGGFHLALQKLGCECVFASELKEDLRNLYKINFPDTPIFGDITTIPIEQIPPHDILCAGFPCQPFSQAGKRQGFDDEKERGNLFDYICAILHKREPEYVLLENVSNLHGHDNGNTWETIQKKLDDLNYWVTDDILSPHQYGIPQHRRRIYIVCRHKDSGTLTNFKFPAFKKTTCDITKIIDINDTKIQKIKPETRNQLEIWQEFIDLTIEHGEAIPTFPIWAMEFGADYEFEEKAPAFQTLKELQGHKGKLGQTINATTIAGCLKQLPIYAQSDKAEVFPHWKVRYIQQNREFYARNKEWLDIWLKKVCKFDNSHLKMEWNCGKGVTPIIEDKIVQFRASGIRIKLPNFSPALNLVGTQIPIFPWIPLPKETLSKGEPTKGRYMSLKEAAMLQGLQDLKFGNDIFQLSPTRAFEALGNAVNATIVKHIAKKMIEL